MYERILDLFYECDKLLESGKFQKSILIFVTSTDNLKATTTKSPPKFVSLSHLLIQPSLATKERQGSQSTDCNTPATLSPLRMSGDGVSKGGNNKDINPKTE